MRNFIRRCNSTASANPCLACACCTNCSVHDVSRRMGRHPIQKQQAHRLLAPADVLSFPLAPLVVPLDLLYAAPELLAPLEEAVLSDGVLPVVRPARERPTDTTWSGDVLYGLLNLSGDSCSKADTNGTSAVKCSFATDGGQPMKFRCICV